MEPFELDPPELTDGVIVLRRMTEDLIPQLIHSFEIEPDLEAKLGLETPPSAEKYREWLPLRDTGAWMAMHEPGTDRYLGDIVVHHVAWENERVELGFYTVLSERRKGIAARAVRLVTDWLFEQGFLRVQMLTVPDNEGTQGVARRAGFEREGLLRSYFVERGNPVDAVIFSAINPRWTR